MKDFETDLTARAKSADPGVDAMLLMPDALTTAGRLGVYQKLRRNASATGWQLSLYGSRGAVLAMQTTLSRWAN